jgi:hypothetical protein
MTTEAIMVTEMGGFVEKNWWKVLNKDSNSNSYFT